MHGQTKLFLALTLVEFAQFLWSWAIGSKVWRLLYEKFYFHMLLFSYVEPQVDVYVVSAENVLAHIPVLVQQYILEINHVELYTHVRES